MSARGRLAQRLYPKLTLPLPDFLSILNTQTEEWHRSFLLTLSKSANKCIFPKRVAVLTMFKEKPYSHQPMQMNIHLRSLSVEQVRTMAVWRQQPSPNIQKKLVEWKQLKEAVTRRHQTYEMNHSVQHFTVSQKYSQFILESKCSQSLQITNFIHIKFIFTTSQHEFNGILQIMKVRNKSTSQAPSAPKTGNSRE